MDGETVFLARQHHLDEPSQSCCPGKGFLAERPSALSNVQNPLPRTPLLGRRRIGWQILFTLPKQEGKPLCWHPFSAV